MVGIALLFCLTANLIVFYGNTFISQILSTNLQIYFYAIFTGIAVYKSFKLPKIKS